MALIDSIILPKPSVMITPGASILTGVPTGNINFGSIVKIYDTSDKYVVNENVAYLTDGQKLVGYSRYQYAIVDEQNILYSEGIPA